MVTKLEWLGRSLEHLIVLAGQLQGRAIDLGALDRLPPGRARGEAQVGLNVEVRTWMRHADRVRDPLGSTLTALVTGATASVGATLVFDGSRSLVVDTAVSAGTAASHFDVPLAELAAALLAYCVFLVAWAFWDPEKVDTSLTSNFCSTACAFWTTVLVGLAAVGCWSWNSGASFGQGPAFIQALPLATIFVGGVAAVALAVCETIDSHEIVRRRLEARLQEHEVAVGDVRTMIDTSARERAA